ncbi:MAG: DUF4394 domain-containing protein [Blastocatellia bacterium]
MMKFTARAHRTRSLSAMLLAALLGFSFQPFGYRGHLDARVSASPYIQGPAIDGTVYAVTTGNNLISFNQLAPGAIIRSAAITGLSAGESIQGIDFRPRTGQLYAVSSQSRVYTIDPATGAAAAIGAGPFMPALAGNVFGVDFNPLPDRIRVVSDADQNLRLNPDTGGVAATDGNLAFAAGDANAGQNPNIVGAAYTNSFSGATTTSLYVIDSNLDVLALQGSAGGAPVSPNTGQLTTVGSLGVNTTDQVGFDIDGINGVAFASLTASGAAASSLYTINLQTGAATSLGQIGGTETVRDIAVVARIETIYAINANNVLISFNSGTPNIVAQTRPVTGLGTGENLLGIDFRPATGELFAVSSAGRVYTLNTSSGAATPVGTTPLNPALAGQFFGFDFNPVPDRIRVVSDAQQNLRLNPATGAVAATDGMLAFAAGDANAGMTPSIVGAAYTNSVAGATSTTLYGIDSRLNALVLQGSIGGAPVSPNTGQLTTVGALGLDTTEDTGFDIVPGTNAAFASLTIPGTTASSTLFTINLATGAATQIGPIGGGATIRDIAIAPRVETVFAVTASNRLISFTSTAPGTILSTATITGLGGGEQVVGLDFRPANGQLYAATSGSRIYVINPLTGAAAPAGAAFTPSLTGQAFGFDFNPVPDRIRLVSNAAQNLRLVPDTGAVAATDGVLAYAQGDARAGQMPAIVGAAYNNSFAGTTTTTLFGIDSGFDALVRQGSPGGAPVSPNTGQLFTVGPLGVDTSDQVGFDIADCTNNAYASLTVGGTPQLHAINLFTGAARLLGAIGGGEQIRGIAIGPQGTPASAQFAGAAAANAASFAADTFAPGSLVAVFGRFQTTNGQLFTASTQPLPTALGGINVKVNGSDAGLLAANNGQINLLLPQSLNDGPATVVVTNADGSTRISTINVQRTAVGIFTFFSNGLGTPAALVTSDGVNFQPVFNPDGAPRPISASTASTPVYLILFVTGLRNAPAANPNDANGVAEAVTATIGTTTLPVGWAGPVAGLSGLDQVNIMLPPQLSGAGLVNVKLSAGGYGSNSASIRIQ